MKLHHHTRWSKTFRFKSGTGVFMCWGMDRLEAHLGCTASRLTQLSSSTRLKSPRLFLTGWGKLWPDCAVAGYSLAPYGKWDGSAWGKHNTQHTFSTSFFHFQRTLKLKKNLLEVLIYSRWSLNSLQGKHFLIFCLPSEGRARKRKTTLSHKKSNCSPQQF